MRLREDPYLPQVGLADYDRRLSLRLFEVLVQIMRKVNGLASGSFASVDGSSTAAPTVGAGSVGDKVWNSAPTELGTAGSKYVILGWVCVADGSPGTWVQMRSLTGN